MKHSIKMLASLIIIGTNLSSFQVPVEFEASEIKSLTTALNSYTLSNYLPSKTALEVEHLIALAEEALQDKEAQKVLKGTVKNIQPKYKSDKDAINKMLKEFIIVANKAKVKKTAKAVKQKPKVPAKIKLPIPLQPKQLNLQNIAKKEAPKIVPVAQQTIPATVKVPAEQFEEEDIAATQLYIGLDVKTHNNAGQTIDWQKPVDIMWQKLGNENFLANDYLHITIAWHSSKNPISPQVIARVEHALARASDILKIVFPRGITDISLLDEPVLLGLNRKNTVAFRVAPSENLKKLQDIILQFLSFENIKDFSHSTFDPKTPLHLSLGKVKNTSRPELEQLIGQLAAPEGARASKGQTFTINTFRLTYSVAGQAWQEKMSYKF